MLGGPRESAGYKNEQASEPRPSVESACVLTILLNSLLRPRHVLKSPHVKNKNYLCSTKILIDGSGRLRYRFRFSRGMILEIWP